VLKHKDMASGVKLTTKEFIDRSKLLHKNKYSYDKSQYVNSKTKIQITCPLHGDFLQVPSSHLSGMGCDKCARDLQAKGRRLTQVEFIKRIKEIFGEKYNFSNTKYTIRNGDVTYICPNHGEVTTKASYLLEGNGCGKCAGKNKTTEEIIELIKNVQGDSYDYSKVKFVNNQTPIILICPVHGEFEIKINNILFQSSGCGKCAGKGLSSEDWVQKFKDVHGDKFTYENFKYKKSIEDVTINCKKHGVFSVSPLNHLQNKNGGCTKCLSEEQTLRQSRTTEEVIKQAKETHGDKYDYSLVNFVRAHDKVKIICPKHGIFEQSMHSHISGAGCIVCGNGWTKDAILRWVIAMRDQLIYLDRVILLDVLEMIKVTRWLKVNGRLEALTTAQVGTRQAEEVVDNIITDLENATEEEILQSQQEQITNINETINEIIINEENQESNEQPIVPNLNPLDELELYNNSMVMKSISGEETMDFYKRFHENKVWNSYINGYIDISQYNPNQNDNQMKKLVMESVMTDYREIEKLELHPDFIKVNLDGSIRDLTMMQKLITVRFRKTDFIGNWSDTGTGKTLAALYSTRDAGCKNIVIVCLNSNVDTWKTEIGYFLNNNIHTKHDFKSRFDIDFTNNQDGRVNYLILNVETFQQDNPDVFIQNLINNNNIDAIIVDEVQSIKTRDEDNLSIRTESVLKFVQKCREVNDRFKLMLMSATPIINNFVEPKNLIELLTGMEHKDISTVENISNGLKLFKFLTRYGIRFRQKRQTKVDVIELDIDGSDINLRTNPIPMGNYLKMEQALLNHKLNAILSHVVKGETLIYIEYVTGIRKRIKEFFNEHGFSVGFYTGDDKEGLNKFKKGQVDILVGSRPITTGINGLQYKVSVMINLIMMWTNSDDQQFRGRVIDRKGIPNDKVVKYIIPIVHLKDGDNEVEYDSRRLDRIRQKGILSDLVLDGQVPKGKLPSRKKLLEEVLNHFNDFEEMINKEEVIVRNKIDIPLNSEMAETPQRKLGDFSEMNRVWSVSNSTTTGERLRENPEEWYQYHTLYREKRKDWNEFPCEVIGNKLKNRPELVVGDFGCGENLLSKMIPNKVHAFDHIAIDETVTACDISNVPLNDNVLDVVVFSLSLMGTNYRDYLVEGHRTLRPFGMIMICEPKGAWEENPTELLDILKGIGFTANIEKTTDRFIYVVGTKI
jgi:hypothetical protein